MDGSIQAVARLAYRFIRAPNLDKFGLYVFNGASKTLQDTLYEQLKARCGRLIRCNVALENDGDPNVYPIDFNCSKWFVQKIASESGCYQRVDCI